MRFISLRPAIQCPRHYRMAKRLKVSSSEGMLVAALSGVLIPLRLPWLRLDPAIASGIFLTTVTDVMGFLFLLGMATLTVV